MNDRTIQRRRALVWEKIFTEKTLGIQMEWTYNIDFTLAKFMLPILKGFKKVHNCYPPKLTWEQWNEYIDKMIRAFELIIEDDWSDASKKEIDEGLDLFREWLRMLWW